MNQRVSPTYMPSPHFWCETALTISMEMQTAATCTWYHHARESKNKQLKSTSEVTLLDSNLQVYWQKGKRPTLVQGTNILNFGSKSKNPKTQWECVHPIAVDLKWSGIIPSLAPFLLANHTLGCSNCCSLPAILILSSIHCSSNFFRNKQLEKEYLPLSLSPVMQWGPSYGRCTGFGLGQGKTTLTWKANSWKYEEEELCWRTAR